MREFKDTAGDVWKIDLPFGEVVRVLEDSSQRFNLLKPEVHGAALDADPLEFYDLLRVLLAPQATERSITPAEFGKRMAGACIVQAQQLFFEEWKDFFRQLQRPDAARGLEFLTENHAKALELMKAELEAREPLLQRASEARGSILSEKLRTSFGSLLAELDTLTQKEQPSEPGESSNDTAKAETEPSDR